MITFDKVLGEVQKIIEDKGEDYVYRAPDEDGPCLYFHNTGKPGCIVGHWMHRYHGVNAVPREGPSAIQFLMRYGPSLIGESLTPKARRFLQLVQGHQDDRVAWGEAVKRALEQIERDNYDQNEEHRT